MAELIRFRCSHCRLKLKAPVGSKGARYLCHGCKKPTIVGSSIEELKAQAALKQKLEGSITEWIRTTCTCGKIIKAPKSWAGKSGICPRCESSVIIPETSNVVEAQTIEVGSDKQANAASRGPTVDPLTPPDKPIVPSIELMPNDEPEDEDEHDEHQEQPADSTDFREIKYERITPRRNKDGFDGFVRAKCQCGFRVKAPADKGGQSGLCPRCGRTVIMPMPPKLRMLSALDAMAEHEELEALEAPNDPGQSAVVVIGAQLTAELAATEALALPVTEDELDEEKRQRAMNIRSYGDKTWYEWIAFKIQVWIWPWRKRFQEMILDNPAVAIGLSVVMLLVGGTMTAFQLKKFLSVRQVETVWKEPIRMTPFYDLGTGKIIQVSSLVTPPMSLNPDPSAPPDPQKMAARAYLFGCGGCEPQNKPSVKLLEILTPAASDAWTRRMHAQRLPHMPTVFESSQAELVGRIISVPGSDTWIPADSVDGLDLRQAVLAGQCPEGQRNVYCSE